MEDKMSIQKHFAKIGGIYLLLAVLSQGLQALLSVVLERFAPAVLENTALTLIISMIPLYCVAMPICIWLLKKLPADRISTKTMGVGKILAALVMTYAGMYLGNILGLVITEGIGLVKGSPVNNDLVEVVMETDLWATTLVAVCIAPLVEELLFRKFLIDRVIKYGEGVAVVLSGIMFGLFHGNLNQFFYATLIGMMFAFLYVKTGRLWYSVLLHIIINFFGSVVAMLVMKNVDLEGIVALESLDPTNTEALMEQVMTLLPSLIIYLGYAGSLLLVVIAGVVIFALNRRKFVCLPGEIGMTAKETRRLVYGNVGMILYVLFWIVMMVIQFMR